MRSDTLTQSGVSSPNKSILTVIFFYLIFRSSLEDPDQVVGHNMHLNFILYMIYTELLIAYLLRFCVSFVPYLSF